MAATRLVAGNSIYRTPVKSICVLVAFSIYTTSYDWSLYSITSPWTLKVTFSTWPIATANARCYYTHVPSTTIPWHRFKSTSHSRSAAAIRAYVCVLGCFSISQNRPLRSWKTSGIRVIYVCMRILESGSNNFSMKPRIISPQTWIGSPVNGWVGMWVMKDHWRLPWAATWGSANGRVRAGFGTVPNFLSSIWFLSIFIMTWKNSRPLIGCL